MVHRLFMWPSSRSDITYARQLGNDPGQETDATVHGAVVRPTKEDCCAVGLLCRVLLIAVSLE